MRWPIHWFFVISLALSIKANTERPKRDLKTLLNIKRSLICKIFGGRCTDSSEKSTSNYVKLFKIPGHDNILVKATPIVRNPERVVEVNHGFASNPTMALLRSYLGTNTSEGILSALERVRTLLASGIISDTVALEKLLVPKPPSIQYGIPTPLDIVSPIYPTTFQAPLELPPKPFAVIPTISGPPHDSYGVPLSESVVFLQERPFRFPTPGIVIPELIAPAPPITFDLSQLALPEFKPVEVQKIIEKPVVPNSYSYHQIHNDGSVTATFETDDKRPEPDLVGPIVERIKQISEKMSDLSVNNLPGVFLPDVLGPVQIQEIPKEASPDGFSYHQVQEDDSVTTFTNGGIQNPVPLSYVGEDNSVVQSVVFDDSSKSVVMSVPPNLSRLIKRPDGKGGFVYERINEDESITTFFDTDGRNPLPLNDSGVNPVPIMQNTLLNRIGHIAETMAISEAQKLSLSTLLNNGETSTEKDQVNNEGPSSSRYFYQQINSDGSVITYTASEKPYDFTQVSFSSKSEVPPSVTLPAPHPPVVKLPGLKPYPIFLEGQDWYTPLIEPALALPLTEVQKVWLPKSRPLDVHKISSTSNNGFSYQQITSDESAIAHNLGNKHFVSVSPPVSFIPGSPATIYGVPFSETASGGNNRFSYHHPPVLEPAGPKPYKIFLEGEDWYTLPLTEVQKVWLPKNRPVDVHKISSTSNNGFSYQQITSDGSAITHNLGNKNFVSVSPPVSFIPGSPATTYGVPFSETASGVETKPYASELPKISLPVFRPVQVEPTAPNGFIYQQILNDGSTAIYNGAGKIERPNKESVSKISPRPYFSTPPGSPHLPPPTISLATPVVTSYAYKQIVPNNQNFKVVNGDHGFSYVKDSTSHTADITQSAEAHNYIDSRVSTATEAGKSKLHGADHDQLNVVVQEASANIHTASGSFEYVQHNDISNENSVNEQNEVTETPRNSSDTSEGTFTNNPIVVAPEVNSSFDEVKEASENVHRGDIP